MAISASPSGAGTSARPDVAGNGPRYLFGRIAAGRANARDAARETNEQVRPEAAASRDIFMDVIVIVSVILFFALAIGIGLLALGSHAPWLS